MTIDNRNVDPDRIMAAFGAKVPLKVVGTTSWAASTDYAESVGGRGGWVGSEHLWPDYLQGMPEEWHPYLEAIRTWVLANDIRRGGDWHQAEGVPQFSDGTVGKFSMLGWGDMFAAIWNTADEPKYTYVDFYMD